MIALISFLSLTFLTVPQPALAATRSVADQPPFAECVMKQNGIILTKAWVNEAPTQEKPQLLGDTGQHELKLLKRGDRYEIEAYDREEPSRTYANGTFTANEVLELTIWKRAFLLEVTCHRYQGSDRPS
jgi:hypothetical protein